MKADRFHIIQLLVFSLLLFACSSEESRKEQYLKDLVLEFSTSLDECHENIIVLPGSGCSGCITVGEDFLKNNHSEAGNYFILTNVTSLKILNHKLGLDVRTLPNVYIDRENKFSNSTDLIYPAVIQRDCESGKIKSIAYQTTENNAFP